MLPPQVAAAERRQVIVRQPLPVPPEQAFLWFTAADRLAQWFCHTAASEPVVDGEVHCTWLDEDGETWQRRGRWAVLDEPSLVILQWSSDDQEAPGEVLRIAIAPAELHDGTAGCVVTVISPLLVTETAFSPDVLIEAVSTGWNMALAELGQLLNSQG